MKNNQFISVFIIFSFIFSFPFLFSCHEEEMTEPEITYQEIPYNTPKLNSITQPAAWSKIKPGSKIHIVWITTRGVETVKILLVRKYQPKYIITENTADDGEYDWNIPSDIDPSHHYRVKLVAKNNSKIYNVSGEFEITPKKTKSKNENN